MLHGAKEEYHSEREKYYENTFNLFSLSHYKFFKASKETSQQDVNMGY